MFAEGHTLEGHKNTERMYPVSADSKPLKLHSAGQVRFFRLQTVLHSVLSTRIVLHTGRALKQDPVSTPYPLVRHQPPAQMVVAIESRVAVGGSLPSGSGIISESDFADVESQRLIKPVT
jgi:hypothetical protein